MFKNPIIWAQSAVQRHGWLHALGVANSCKSPLGWDQSGVNPFSDYWTNAFNWLKKRAPKEALEDLARRIQAQQEAKLAAMFRTEKVTKPTEGK